MEERLTAAATVAGAAGANVKVGSGSVLEVLAEQEAEFMRERKAIEKVGASRASAALQRGESVAKQATYGGYQSLFSGLLGAAQAFNKGP